MAEPSEDLQKAIYDILIADPAVSAVVGASIFDGQPKSFPCITFGARDFTVEDYDCIEGRRFNQTLHCWTREEAARSRLASALGDKVTSALHRVTVDLQEHALADIRVSSVRTFMDPDGETAHCVVSIEALIEVQ